jgi:hypothetical protein
MKKLIFIILFITFLAGRPSLTYAVTFSGSVQTATVRLPDDPVMTDLDTKSSLPENIDYDLPYPGILLDHPLYFLKKLRDRIMLSLLTDPTKLIEFNILQSDKFLSMAVIYETKHDPVRLTEALDLSFTNMASAYDAAKHYKSTSGILPDYISSRFENSLAKHLELMQDFTASVPDTQKRIITNLIDEFTRLQTGIAALKS